MLCEVGELGEVIRAWVLYDDDAVALEESRAKDHLWEGSDLLQLVRWVGKDEVELRSSALRGLEVAEDIGLQDLQAPFLLQLASDGANEERVLPSLLERDHTATASGDELCRYAARPAEEVNGRGVLKVDVVLKDVEEVLLGKVCRRASIEALGYVEAAALVLTSDDAHVLLSLWGCGYLDPSVREATVALDGDLRDVGAK